jgi:16S rRNA G1207 methylase RsmC
MAVDHTKLDALRQDIILPVTLREQRLVLHSTWGLFSPRAIDEGTQLLLDELDVRSDERALDLGCGYGPLGLTIARLAPQGSCLMVDKDFVAVDYANANAKRNGISNASAQLSDGLNHLPTAQRFTLVVTNLPAKTSNEHYYLFFQDVYDHLEPGGRFYLVVISGLRQFIKRALTEIFGNHTKVRQGKQYTVAMAVKN